MYGVFAGCDRRTFPSSLLTPIPEAAAPYFPGLSQS